MSPFHAKQFLLHGTSAYILLISRPWKKIHRDQYCSKYNLSMIAPVGEGRNLTEQTITVCGGQLLHQEPITQLLSPLNLQIAIS